MIEPTIPNLLTAFRIALIPVFSGVFFIPGWGPQASAVLFALASLTDWADGYLARRLGQSSAFGAFLDPVADKLIVCVALVLLVSRDNSLWLVAPACVIIGREIAISALREWLAGTRARSRISVSWLGKFKTLLQLVSLVLLLWAAPDSSELLYVYGLVLLGVAAAMTLVSMAYYLWLALRHENPEAPGS